MLMLARTRCSNAEKEHARAILRFKERLRLFQIQQSAFSAETAEAFNTHVRPC